MGVGDPIVDDQNEGSEVECEDAARQWEGVDQVEAAP
jgi:hypothetical protein